MAVTDDVILVLRDTLQLGERARSFDPSTRLLGSIPEFDSMAVVSVVGALEDHFDIVIDDDDISAETFETVGTVAALVEEKVAA